MENTTRDRTEEHRDGDNPGDETIPPPRQPAPTTSPHVPGSATEMAELNRTLADDIIMRMARPDKGS
jgi:hypothetical protein